MVINFNQLHQGKRNPDGRLGGILIEAKNGQLYRDLYGIEIAETILQTLRKYGIDTIDKAKTICPVYLHSFDFQSIIYWSEHSELPRNYLLFEIEPFKLEQVNKYANGIGFEDYIIWDYARKTPNPVLEKAKDLGLLVHVWTFKDEKPIFNATTNIVFISYI